MEMEKERLYNFTPHPVVIKLPGGDLLIEPSGITVRLSEALVPAGQIELAGHPVDLFKRELGEVSFAPVMPELEAGDIVIVSSLVAPALKSQKPELVVLVPGEAVRDEEGKIVGVRNLFVIE
jgi:hypothetical protein